MKMVHLQEDVSTIMDGHLPEVLPLHVEKLKKRSQSLKTVEWNLVSQKLE